VPVICIGFVFGQSINNKSQNKLIQLQINIINTVMVVKKQLCFSGTEDCPPERTLPVRSGGRSVRAGRLKNAKYNEIRYYRHFFNEAHKNLFT
jgi:hypothetical protein